MSFQVDDEFEPGRLHRAAGDGDLDTLEAALRAGADPDAADPVTGETLLQRAIDGCHEPERRYSAVALLLSRGADPCVGGPEGRGPLFLALVHQDHRVLELLLRSGADPESEVGYGDKSLLWWARADYLHDTYGRTLPERPDAATWDDVAALTRFLDHLAHRHRRPRPEALRLLWVYGARSF